MVNPELQKEFQNLFLKTFDRDAPSVASICYYLGMDLRRPEVYTAIMDDIGILVSIESMYYFGVLTKIIEAKKRLEGSLRQEEDDDSFRIKLEMMEEPFRFKEELEALGISITNPIIRNKFNGVPEVFITFTMWHELGVLKKIKEIKDIINEHG